MRIKVPVSKDDKKSALCPICHQGTLDIDVPPTEWAIRHTMDTGHMTICGTVYRWDDGES